MWNNPRALELSAMFETYVVSEIIKGYANQGIDVRSRMFSYRDNNEKNRLFIRMCGIDNRPKAA